MLFVQTQAILSAHSTPQASSKDVEWPAQFLGAENTTRGTWSPKYGSAGYVLFYNLAQVSLSPFSLSLSLPLSLSGSLSLALARSPSLLLL